MSVRRRITSLLLPLALVGCSLATPGLAQAAGSGGAGVGPSTGAPSGGAALTGATRHRSPAHSDGKKARRPAKPKPRPRPRPRARPKSKPKSTPKSRPRPRPSTTGVSTPAPSSGTATGNQLLAYAQQFTGTRYVYGGNGPDTFDCSGFTSYVFAHFGYHLNRSSYDQMREGTAVHGALQVGDLVFFDAGGHVGIYAGDHTFISATVHRGIWTYSFAVWEQSQSYTTARRILGDFRLVHSVMRAAADSGMPRNGGPADATP